MNNITCDHTKLKLGKRFLPIEVTKQNLLINYLYYYIIIIILCPNRPKLHTITDYFSVHIFIVKTKIVPKLSRKYKANVISLYYIQNNFITQGHYRLIPKFYPTLKY